jgi:HK97 gp10 family phage protein
MRMQFTGGREMTRALRTMGQAAAEVLETGVVAGAGIVRARAAELAPRPSLRRRPRTVRLSDSIKVEVREKDRAHVLVHVGTRIPFAHLVEFGHRQIARGPGRKALGSQQRVKTAVRVNWKTVRRKRKDGTVVTKTVLVTRHRSFVTGMHGELRRKLTERRRAGAKGFVAARPFLRPAFDETRERVIRRMAEVIGKGIEQHWRRLAEQAPARAA